MPKERSLNRSPHRYSQHDFIAMNSDPKELVSIPVCFLDDQYIGALFRNIMKPERDRLVIRFPAWSAST